MFFSLLIIYGLHFFQILTIFSHSSQTEAMTNSKKYNYPGLKSVSDDPLSVLTVPLRPYEEVNLVSFLVTQ